MDDRLRNIIKFMQGIDRNGNWDGIEQDIKDGNTTLETELFYIAETLEEWLSECSIEHIGLIREHLQVIQEVYNIR